MQQDSDVRINGRRAAVLSGLSLSELRLLASQAAVGRLEQDGELVLSYDELRKICLLAAPATE